MPASPPDVPSPLELPILAHREAIVAAIQRHPVVIVAGDTGSGKTTQIPKFCLELGRGDGRLIGCTQPRRLAAVSVAERVAQELASEPGALVGWQHRFGRCLSATTRIKFMTDGILLSETRGDPDLRRYDTIMIDEAHERTLNIDFLLGYLKLRLPRRPDLKIVVSSATLDVARFSAFFHGAPVVEVPGRMYPVEVRYRPPRDEEEDLARLVADGVDELLDEGPGDILVFLPGERDIRAAAETLRGRALPDTEVLPLMSSLPPAEQRRAFRVLPGRRRIILATNVAETSLTLPGIRKVVDSGLARISRFNHRTQIQRLHIEPVSRASAEQRKGRCGRLGPGICLRLYDEEEFLRRDAYTDPEIRRTSLGGVILAMADLRLGPITEFPFLDPPAPAMVREGYRELTELAAIDAAGQLTPLGRQLARLPIEPRYARMLVAAAGEQSLRDALIVVAALASEDPRMRPLDHQAEADKAQAQFLAETSDFSGLLRLWRWYHDAARNTSRGAARRLCIEHFLSFRRMDEWIDVREQLEHRVRALGFDPASAPATGGEEALHRALLTGMLSQIGQRDPEKGDYRGARALRFAVHPGSGLFKKQPAWLMAAELVDTARLYARRAAAIHPEWIEPLARHLCKVSHHSPYWDAEAGTARALERVLLHGLLLSDGRRRDYSRIDPAFSRELFIRHGLVEGALPRPVPEVVRANLALFETLRDAGRKTRGKVVLDEEELVAAYHRNLPPEVVNLAMLRDWLRKATPDAVERLRFSAASFPSAEAPASVYPDHVVLAGHRLALTYRHAPDADDDGITCSVPVGAIPWLRRWPADWLVPGLLPEKVAWMVSALAKPLPRPLPPMARVLPRLLARLDRPGVPLREALSRALADEFGLRVAPESWSESTAPAHLRLRYRILDERQREVFASRELAEVEEFHTELRRLTGTAAAWPGGARFADRDGLVSWDCGPLPEAVELGTVGWRLVNHPALVDAGTCVHLRWFADADSAARQHAGGVRRLYLLALGKALAATGGRVVPRDAALSYRALGGTPDELGTDVVCAAVDAVLLPPTEAVPRDADSFRLRLETRRGLLDQTVRTQWQLVLAALALAAERERELVRVPLLPDTAEDLHEQLAWLVYPGFARHTPPGRLEHYGRYLEALRLRIQRAAENPARDLSRMAQVRPCWTRYCDAVKRGDAAGQAAADLDAYRWAVEEFRVSQFAQELRTPEPVSPQRLDRLWDRAMGIGK